MRHSLALPNSSHEVYLHQSRPRFENACEYIPLAEWSLINGLEMCQPSCNVKFTYFGTGELLVKTSP